MSAAKWKTQDALPYGFRVTIERTGRDSFTPERHTFPSKTPRRNTALQAASYKHGFLRVVTCEPLTREEWERAYPVVRISHRVSRK